MWAYPLYILLRALALLPFPVLYGLSDGLYFMMSRLVRHRAAVIDSNLKTAFPGASPGDIRRLRNGFYRNFCDLLVESVKSLNISERQMKERLSLEDDSVFRYLKEKGRNVLVVWGHHHNFEWMATGLPLVVPQNCFAVYHPLKNPVFRRAVVRVRQQFGLMLYPMAETYPFMMSNRTPDSLYIFMADQSPHRGKIKYYTDFFGRPTPVHLGVENLSKKLDLAVVFISTRRVKRGHYRLRAEMLFEDPRETKEYEITDTHVKKLEEVIRNDPPNWLWSHRRWKYQPEENETGE